MSDWRETLQMVLDGKISGRISEWPHPPTRILRCKVTVTDMGDNGLGGRK